MNLGTNYLGFELPNPLIVGAGPITESVDRAKRYVDAGASAVVLYSLFEEQIVREQIATDHALHDPAQSFPEALTYLPEPDEVKIGPERYLEQIAALKKALNVPVIASLNGISKGGWIRYAKLIEEAGASALELNTYSLATDPQASAVDLELRALDVVRAVREQIKIPLAVKLSPFYTSLPHFARQLAGAGANALVLFNRLYQPDIDPDNLEVLRLNLSDSSELPLRLHWLAILFGRVDVQLAITGGVRTAIDVVKCCMAGASVVQMVSTLLRDGPTAISHILKDLQAWMTLHEYESVRQMRGSMSLIHSPNPSAYIRDNYMQVLHSWKATETAV